MDDAIQGTKVPTLQVGELARARTSLSIGAALAVLSLHLMWVERPLWVKNTGDALGLL